MSVDKETYNGDLRWKTKVVGARIAGFEPALWDYTLKLPAFADSAGNVCAAALGPASSKDDGAMSLAGMDVTTLLVHAECKTDAKIVKKEDNYEVTNTVIVDENIEDDGQTATQLEWQMTSTVEAAGLAKVRMTPGEHALAFIDGMGVGTLNAANH